MDVQQLVRETIYARTVTDGRVPAIEEIASEARLGADEVVAACRALADAHVIVLQPHGTQLWAAPPFSAVPTRYRVHAASVAWYAPCAWDAFGIAAAISQDVTIEARCAWSGEPLPLGVGGGEAFGVGVIHLEVPAKHFWDDIYYT